MHNYFFCACARFWGLDSNQVEPCCWKTYTKHRNTEETLEKLEKLCLDDEKTSDNDLAIMFGLDEDPNWQNGTLPWYRKIQPLVWQLFYEPQSSRTAMVKKRHTLKTTFFSLESASGGPLAFIFLIF